MEMSKIAIKCRHVGVLDYDRVARTMGLFWNLRQTQHPERYYFVLFYLFYYKAVNHGKFHKHTLFMNKKLTSEQKLREIDKRI